MKSRIKYCIANFKMNLGTKSKLSEYFKPFDKYIDTDTDSIKIIVSPPFTVINQAVDLTSKINKNIKIGAQNINENISGAYTGEISIDMIKDCRINYVITGHSERRSIYKENNKQINAKNRALLSNNIAPIFCIGETLEQRSKNLIEKTLREQLTIGLNNISNSKIILAYEPVWAIGTGKTATAEIITDTHLMIRNILNDIGFDGQKISILYGGSVNRNNAKDLIALADVDGFLIGGASLDAKHFLDIYNIIEESI